MTINDDKSIASECSDPDEYVKIIKYLYDEGIIDIEDYKPKGA